MMSEDGRYRIRVDHRLVDDDDFYNYYEYFDMINWLSDNISPPMQEFDSVHNPRALGRCGEGWEFRLDWDEAVSGYGVMRWYVFIEDETLAVMFKLQWA